VNPAGEHLEYWHHTIGCGKWFKVSRNTTNNEIYGSSKP
jgi:sarcosine oxidase subunit delta